MADQTSIEALASYAGDLSEAAAKATAASQKQHQIVNGDAQTDVQTESGPVPSFAKQAVLAQAKVTSALVDVAAQMAGAMTYASTAAGLASTVNGAYFSVPSPETAEYIILYKNVAGSAVEQKRYPAASALNAAVDSTTAAAQYVEETLVEITQSKDATENAADHAAASAASAQSSANNAVAVVTGGTASLSPAPGLMPIADAEGRIPTEWLRFAPAGQGSGAMDVGAALRAGATGGLGDFTVDQKLMIFCGDSTTEQMKGAGYGFDRLTNLHRKNGGRFAGVLGTINFGGSGYTLNGFLNDSAVAPPVIQSNSVGAVSEWDYYGHKPVGAISLGTALAWRAQQAAKVVWVSCFGINDCILNAAVGNLSQAEITDYIAQRLRAVITRINAAFPGDEIVLRMPNPMTARPYVANAGFPSAAAYPNFGTDLAADQALVEKWNRGLRSAYLAVRAGFPRTILFDTWPLVFGDSNTTLTAGTELKFLGDLVHPSGPGYVRLADALVNVLAPEATGKSSRRVEADLRATALGGDGWTYYPHYFRDNPVYKRVLRIEGWVGIGANYLDLSVMLADFLRQVDSTKPIYVAIGGIAAQAFLTYTASVSGTNTRLTGVAPSALMQAAVGEMEVYQTASSSKTSDAYLMAQFASIRPRDAFLGKVSGSGNGYIDVVLDAAEGRPSTKYIEGVLAGKLLIGGGSDTTLSLSGFTVGRNGTSAIRTFRLLKSGDYSAYSGKACAVVFDDSAPSPRAQEAVFAQRSVVPHAKGARCFVHCPVRMFDGATIQVFLTEIIAQDVSVEVYRVRWPARTLIGSMTISANASSASLANGNQTDVTAGSIYELIVTSATSQPTGLVGLAVVPL